jgi:antitoxin ParD1/3/4
MLLGCQDRDPPMTMNINLTPQLEQLVREKVSSGRYTSASEVVREALRLMEEQDRLRAVKLEQLRRDIRDGMESGPAISWNIEKMKREGRKQMAARLTSRTHK